MQVETPDRIRTVALVGHNDSGKTTLASSLLYAGGAVNRLNRIEDGNTVTDFDTEEVKRGISIGLAPCFVPWNKHKINFIDCPGYGIFFTEARAGMHAADAALVCIDAVAGPKVMTERTWKFTDEVGLPVLFHLTKMDRERADLDTAVNAVQKLFGKSALPVQVPIGSEGSFTGVVDLVHNKAYSFDRDGNGKGKEIDVPGDLADTIDNWRTQLIEAVAEADDELLEKYFEEGTLSQEELEQGLRKAVQQRTVFPITLSSALHGVGMAALLDSLITTAPAPLDRGTFPATNVGGDTVDLEVTADGPLRALVFKTFNDPFAGKLSIFRIVSGSLDTDSAVWNATQEQQEKLGHTLILQGKQGEQVAKLVAGDIGAIAKLKHTHTGDTLCPKDAPTRLGWIFIREPAISFAIEPKSKGDEEKINEAVARLMEEDVTLQSSRDPETHEHLLSGTGGQHIEIVVDKLKSRYKVEVILHPPKVPYRETIKKTADGHGRHKKQSGGRGQFADCRIIMEPAERGTEFEFLDEIFGGSIPQGFRPAVEKGIQEARMRGYLAGYPVVDFRVRLKDGQYHDVDSSEMAFKIAGSLAFKEAMQHAKPTILEPMMQVEISTTEEFMGDIMGDLTQRRGRPQGMDVEGDNQVIKATAPMSEMLDYARALRALTQGRSSFHMEYSHYEEVPKQIQEKLIAEAEARKAAEH